VAATVVQYRREEHVEIYFQAPYIFAKRAAALMCCALLIRVFVPQETSLHSFSLSNSCRKRDVSEN
jgi:hypothetical protein